MPQPAISIDRVSKSYGARQVLDSVSLEVAIGESVALIGLNGMGKTTLLRCLLDFQRPDSGAVRVQGVPALRPDARVGVSYLPERFHAPTFLTGLEFLRMSARLYGIAWDPVEARARCQTLALDGALLALPVARLSKGSAQKLGLAACLLSRRQVYILDEPLSGLDVQARALALNQLLRLREEGCTLLFTCHEPADVDQLCHRVALLHDGVLRFCGTPQALRERHPGPTLEASVLACLACAGTHGAPAP